MERLGKQVLILVFDRRSRDLIDVVKESRLFGIIYLEQPSAPLSRPPSSIIIHSTITLLLARSAIDMP